MSAERDVNRIVRSWLRSDEHESADRVLQTVLSRLDMTPQRRSWWPPRRFAYMNAYTRIAIAAAAVAIVAVVGYTLLPPNSNIANPPTPTPIVTSPLATPKSIAFGDLDAGTYFVDGWDGLLPFTVTVPAGWRYNPDGFIMKGPAFEPAGASGVAFAVWQVTHVYGDACRWAGTLEPISSRQLLFTALKDQGGFVGGKQGSSDTSLGGYPVEPIEISVATDMNLAACQSAALRLWPDPGPDESGGHRIWPGQTTTVYPVEKDGNVFAVFTVRNEGSPSGDVVELDAILHSVQFLP